MFSLAAVVFLTCAMRGGQGTLGDKDLRRTRDLIFFLSSEEPDTETTMHPATNEREKKTDYSPNRYPNRHPWIKSLRRPHDDTHQTFGDVIAYKSSN